MSETDTPQFYLSSSTHAPRPKQHQTLSRNLKKVRKLASLSVRDASQQLRKRGIAVGERYLRQWENLNDAAEPILSDMADICEVYGCRMEDLFAETDEFVT